MWLDPTPAKPVVSKRKSGASANGKKHFPIYGGLQKLVSLDFLIKWNNIWLSPSYFTVYIIIAESSLNHDKQF